MKKIMQKILESAGNVDIFSICCFTIAILFIYYIDVNLIKLVESILVLCLLIFAYKSFGLYANVKSNVFYFIGFIILLGILLCIHCYYLYFIF